MADGWAGKPLDVLLVTGEPGIGKTRLLMALDERVAEAGGLCVCGRAYEVEQVRPYAYLARLEALLDHTVDRHAFNVSWHLGWLRVFCQLGFLLADPLTEPDSSAEVVKCALARCRTAVEYARQIADAHVW